MIWSKDQSIQAHFEYLDLWIYAVLFNHIYVYIQYSNSHSSDLADTADTAAIAIASTFSSPDPTLPFHHFSQNFYSFTSIVWVVQYMIAFLYF